MTPELRRSIDNTYIAIHQLQVALDHLWTARSVAVEDRVTCVAVRAISQGIEACAMHEALAEDGL